MKSTALQNLQSPLLALTIMMALVGAVPSLNAATTTLSAVADVSLMENNKGELNTGGDSQIAGGVLANGERTRILLRFDLSSLPATAVIKSVTLTTTAVKQNFSAPGALFIVHRMLVAWQEGRGTGSVGESALPGEAAWQWRAAPSDVWATPGGKPGTDFVTASSSSAEIRAIGSVVFQSSAQLVADAQAWVSQPQSNFGWVLKAADEKTATTARRFASREADEGGPSLDIEYELPIPELKVSSPVLSPGKLSFGWSATTPPYQVQTRSDISAQWVNLGPPQQGAEVSVPTDGSQGYFRVIDARPQAR
ncbi:MAG: DNRLRE domain-containing protein [Verrucomicrobia bacterium]|nr:DNRLRE domain-containing protein [Verrucomicrobiota bacterium]MBI3867091.1 DNRLRE domain-containing protein [Verrucomicrobiota bacterium]